MSKITKRRKRTAKANIENKAVMAPAPAVRREFPYKAILVLVLALISIVACALMIVNIVVDVAFSKFADPADRFNNAVATEAVTDEIYTAPETIMATSPRFADAYKRVVANRYSEAVVNVKSSDDILNYVVVISDEIAGEASDGVVITMLVSVNKADKKITCATLNKALAVVIPTVGVGPLYDAYEYGGIKLLTRTVEDNYGIAINGYFDFTLASFLEAAEDLGGIVIDGEKYATYEDIAGYIKGAEDREVATKDVVTKLAAGAKDAGILGLGKLVKSANSLKASVSEEDFAALLSVGVRAFKTEATVINVGYETYKLYNILTYCDYATEIAALHAALGY